jgi:hypothetical protein
MDKVLDPLFSRYLIAHMLVGLYDGIAWRDPCFLPVKFKFSTPVTIASAISLADTDLLAEDMRPEMAEVTVLWGDSPKEEKVFLSIVDEALTPLILELRFT